MATAQGNEVISRGIAWNYAGALYELVAGVVLVGFIVRHVSVTEYGVLLLALSLVALVSLLDLGLSSLLVQAYVAAFHKRAELSKLISTAFVALLAVGVTTSVAFAAIALLLPGAFHIPPQYLAESARIFLLVSFSLAASMPSIALELAYQAADRFDRLNQISAAVTTARFVFTVLALSLGYGVTALAAIQAATTFLRLLLLYAFLHASVPEAAVSFRSYEWNVLKPLLRPGGWAALDNGVRQLSTSADSIILGAIGSVSGVALFGVGSKAPTQLVNMVSRGAIVILPSLARHHVSADLERLREIYVHTQRLVFTGALPVVVLGCLCAKPLIHVWAGDAYAGAAPIMQLLLVSALSVALEYPSDLVLYARGEIGRAARIATAESFAKIVLAVILVFRYGALGVAAATAITHIVISFGWYAPASCKAANMTLKDLAGAVFGSSGWAFALLAVEAIALYATKSALPPAAVLAVGTIFGMLYLWVWLVKMVIPLRRLQANPSV